MIVEWNKVISVLGAMMIITVIGLGISLQQLDTEIEEIDCLDDNRNVMIDIKCENEVVIIDNPSVQIMADYMLLMMILGMLFVFVGFFLGWTI